MLAFLKMCKCRFGCFSQKCHNVNKTGQVENCYSCLFFHVSSMLGHLEKKHNISSSPTHTLHTGRHTQNLGQTWSNFCSVQILFPTESHCFSDWTTNRQVWPKFSVCELSFVAVRRQSSSVFAFHMLQICKPNKPSIQC